MKVMLVQPPLVKKQTIGPSLGLGYLASSLEKTGHKVKILESIFLSHGISDIKKEIKHFDPDVVGVTAMTQYIYDALSIVKIAKENNPNCMTVMGGPHPTVRAREILEKNSYVDAIVRREGEKTFTELIEKKKEKDLSLVRGLSFRLDGRIIENKDREFIADLDSLPFPAYHLLSMKKYKIKFFDAGVLGNYGQSYGAISTCRGCPFSCIFCSSCELWGRRWRARSPENVVEELKLLRNRYGMEVIDFMDDTFTLDKRRVVRICKLIKEEDIDISIICTTRVDLFNKEIACALKKAGCRIVFFGFESGVQKMLDVLNKGFRVEDSEKAVKIARQAGLNVGCSFMIGIPGETKEMINQTVAFAKKLELKFAAFNLFVPFPGTKIYEMAEENNLLLTKDWSKYATYNAVMKIPGFTTRELKRIRKRAEYSFTLKHLLP